MPLFMVSILYRHTDGRDVEACALIGCPNAPEAIELACRAVLDFPHCAELIGGTCEEMGHTDNTPIARDTIPTPASATRH